MRESNFAFPTQNKACVCITSQLYDRRALDTTAPLPLFNSLTHLTYLTSTSPRIREIMTMDGGLERLVKILHDFCICPPPPENAAILYGLMPPNSRPPKLNPTLNPQHYDKQAAYRFSLAFQCVVNIGVRGSEPIRSRVVQAGTLDVVGCVLEAWLANKGFAIGPSSSATGLPRETREQRQARRDAHMLQRQREQAAQLARQLEQMQQQEQLQQQRRVIPRPSLALAPVHDSFPAEVVTYSSSLQDETMYVSPSANGSSEIFLLSTTSFNPSGAPSASNSDTDMSTTATPIGSGTPTGSVIIPGRDRSGTIIARPVWDPSPAPDNTDPANLPPTGANFAITDTRTFPGRHRTYRRESGFSHSSASASPSTDNSRPETETEDDGDDQGDHDGDIDMNRAERRRLLRSRRRIDSDGPSTSASPSPERSPRPPFPHPHHQRLSLSRRAVGIISDETATGEVGAMELSTDAHIIINDAGGVGEGAVGMGVGGVGVEDGLVSLEPNDDFAMGAPPGAPGAIEETPTARGLPLETGRRVRSVQGDAPDITPRAGVVGLPTMDGGAGAPPGRVGPLHPNHQQHHHGHHQRNATIRGRTDTPIAAAAAGATPGSGVRPGSHGTLHHDAGIYRDEDVLLGLQLLAYLSKYPHVRQAFYKPRASFHPASVNLAGAQYGEAGKMKEKEREKTGTDSNPNPSVTKDTQGAFRGFASGRGRDKDRDAASAKAANLSTPTVAPSSTALRQTNVFSLVERFTFKPSSSETDLPNPPPRLPAEIQYWAGVIMRNACRKDDSRGGIRQCANMLCGRWESYPREFAKCRRCRKAKYCGKECQSTAWSEGHRFWCSAKDGDDDVTGEQHQHHQHGVAGQTQTPEDRGEITIAPDDSTDTVIPVTTTPGTTVVGRPERRRERTQAVVSNAGDADHARGGATLYRGTVVHGNTRGEGSTTLLAHQQLRLQQHPQHQVPVVPSPARTRGIDARPQMVPTPGSPVNNNALIGNGTYLTADMYPELGGGRRRAETVTGATNVVGEASLRAHHHPHFHVHSRNHPPNPMRFVPVQHGRSPDPQTLTTRRRRGDNGTVTGGGFRLPVEDHDMVLG